MSLFSYEVEGTLPWGLRFGASASAVTTAPKSY